MKTKQRFRRQRELEQIVSQLIEKGWAVQSLTYADEEDEPFRVHVTLRVEEPSATGWRL